MSGQSTRPSAVFLDRDGVVIRDVGYLRSAAGIRLLPGAARAIRRLNHAGIPVVIVTNQSAVARGWLSLQALDAIHAELKRRLARSGARLDAIYFCPHHPTEAVGSFRVECDCRKPNPGMLIRAARELGFRLSDAVIIGDKPSDLEVGRRAGCRTVLVLSGEGAGTLRGLNAAGLTHLADAISATFPKAIDWCLGTPALQQEPRPRS